MTSNDVEGHYSRGNLYQIILDALSSAGKDVGNLRPEDLDPLDHFHDRGVAATAEMVATLELSMGDEVLDIGSSVGGPARFVARTYDCQVVGFDLTAEFLRRGGASNAGGRSIGPGPVRTI